LAGYYGVVVCHSVFLQHAARGIPEVSRLGPTMKSSKLILSVAVAASAIFGVGNASAADMAVKAPVYKAPSPIDPWVGFYVGANIGGSWGDWSANSKKNL
jgi:hypothetical protein